MSDVLSRQVLNGENGTLVKFSAKQGAEAKRHSHISEEYYMVVFGAAKFVFDDREVMLQAGDILVVPSNNPHAVVTMEDSGVLDFFAPLRQDWLEGKDQYMRE